MSEKQGYRTKLVMHMNFGRAGGTRTVELVDHPGVFVQDEWDAKKRKNTRTVVYKDKEYQTVRAAVNEEQKGKR